MQDDKNIKFWLPASIKKAYDDNGNEVMRLGGIASTIDEDSDGESLDPSGFDVKPLLESGVVNWHHQAKGQPKTIIGEPTKAELRKDEGLYIETDLYPSSQVARDVFDLAKTLEKDSKTRRLGYSIEGKVLKRKSNDKKSPDYKKILKAVITGVAITHQPKNHNTFANIIKGKGVEDEGYEEVEENDEEKESVIKKELNTQNAAALKKESVDGELKVSLTKAEVLDKLFSDIPNLSIEKGEKIFNLITKISNMKNKGKAKSITDEDIQKAYDALGVDELEKGCSTGDEVVKGDDEKAEGDEGKKETKKEVEEAAADADNDNETEKGENPDIMKAIETNIMKANEQTNKLIKSVGVLVQDARNAIAKTTEALEKAEIRENELIDLVKAQNEELDILKSQLEEFGAQTPPAKSLTHSNVVERNFDKGEEAEMEKGGNSKVLSVSKNKSVIVELLDQATFAKGGYDNEFGKACTTFESSGVLPAAIIERMDKEFGVKIVK